MTLNDELARAWDAGHRARGSEQNPFRVKQPTVKEAGGKRCQWGRALYARGAWCPLVEGHLGPHIEGTD